MSRHPDFDPTVESADLPPHERRALLTHLRGCERCRARWAANDPSVLFSLLAIEPVPEDVLERVSRGARTAIAAEADRRIGGRWIAWGSIAASVLVAALLGAYLWRQAPIPVPVPEPVDLTAGGAEPSADTAMPAGMIEFLELPGSADVVEMSVGDVEVVMIFDETMGI